MVLLELLLGQYFNYLRVLSYEVLNVLAIDLLRHRHSPSSAQACRDPARVVSGSPPGQPEDSDERGSQQQDEE